MQRNITVNLGNLVLSLSDAMDLANPALIQHQQRTAFVVWEMGKAARLSNERLERIFIAALLHDIGAFSLEEKISVRNFEVENLEEHCIRGELLLNNIPWLKDSASIIRFHHTEWQHWGESIETPIVFESQLLFLADYLERAIKREHYILLQHEDILSTIESLSGSSLHPQVVDLFNSVNQSEEFWLDLVSPRLYSLLLNEGPFSKKVIGYSDISVIAELFRNIIDFKSRFTSTHSSGVAASASMLARIFGLTDTEIGLMEVAGNLHDIGKLVIPNSILDKPGSLAKDEMSVMKSHTYYTYSVINTIGGLNHIAEWAAYHHERLDGSGYPFHCVASGLSTGARILMVADIFTALAEDRPYRKGMSKDGIVQIIKQFSDGNRLDTRIVNLLFENYNDIFAYVAEKQTVAREFYEKQFMSTR
ncbi:HD domain-containing phosphohydrolase [Geobacter argillaceus]|uniref:HD-GYP domain-containing protein (C-di-GMP phosphodiesterase class II) n=1 Tax=Geobacter argillaceus TaxID=345631 RepID=A0A562VLE5_9BACT|nr:HD domain-containing phosphohydrolase [Geobacter argillaceus]TWJ18749.1 HD-GYP domain-containing protein (c-di-GMP phosphodiesterase class II) [Geobacter argillaceus]